MNHDEIWALLAAYVDDELPGSQRTLVEGHVAGCPECRAELAALTAMQRQLRKTLHARAGLVEAPAGGWAALQGRMAAEPVPVALPLARSGNHARGALSDEPAGRGRALRVFSLAFALIGVLVFAWLVIISPLIGRQTASPGEKKKTPTPTLVGTPFTPGPDAATPIPTVSQSFTALLPGLLPAGLAYMDDSILPDGSRQMVFYTKHNDQFLVVTQSDAGHAAPPPADGRQTSVGNLPAVESSGQSGQVKAGGRAIRYQDALALAWSTPFGTQLAIVSNLPRQKIRDFAERLAVPFTNFDSDGVPVSDESWSTIGSDSIDAGRMVREVHHYSNTHFIAVVEQADLSVAAAATPPGDPITLASGIEARITRGLSGTGPAQAGGSIHPRPGEVVVGGGGGGGGGPDYTPPTAETIDYTAGIRLTWSQGGTAFEVLTNVTEQEALKYAARMVEQPAAIPPLVTGATVDSSVLPQGGALVGYVTNASEVPKEFYANTTLLTTEGDGELIEARYYSDNQFVIVTTRRDDGQPLPQGDAVQVGARTGVLEGDQQGTARLSEMGDFGNSQTATMQDSVPRYIIQISSGLVGPKDPTAGNQDYPHQLGYQGGSRLTWTLDGARLTLLTNLGRDQALDIAARLTIVSRDYVVINPVSLYRLGPLTIDGFDLWAPTYLPDALDQIAPLDPNATDAAGKPAIFYWNAADPSQFVILRERAAKPDEFVNTPMSSVLLGRPWLLEQVSGSFDSPYSGTKVTYKDAARITVIVDGTWIQLLTSLPQAEARKIAESLVKGR